MQNINDVIASHSGLSRATLDYSVAFKSIMDGACDPGFSMKSWEPLAALVDTANFERVGNFKEVMNWAIYTGFLTNWAPHALWDCSFKRITESGRTVFLEMEERTTMGGVSNAVNSLSVYEFTDEGKIRHLDIYLQMPMADPAMFKGYDGVDISG
jgi:hypothetical protein